MLILASWCQVLISFSEYPQRNSQINSNAAVVCAMHFTFILSEKYDLSDTDLQIKTTFLCEYPV